MQPLPPSSRLLSLCSNLRAGAGRGSVLDVMLRFEKHNEQRFLHCCSFVERAELRTQFQLVMKAWWGKVLGTNL